MVDKEVIVSGRRGWVSERGDEGYRVQFYDKGESLWSDLEGVKVYHGKDDYPDWIGLTLIEEESGEPWVALRFDPETAARMKAVAAIRSNGDIGALFEEMLSEQFAAQANE